MINEIHLPWPPKELSPNARVHWSKKAKATKSYRFDGAWATKLAKVKVTWDGEIKMLITFNPPDKRHYDKDNCLSRIKAGLDGVADALNVNDRRFNHEHAIKEAVKGGRVVIQIFHPENSQQPTV